MAEVLRTAVVLGSFTLGGSCAGIAVTHQIGGGAWQATLLGMLLLPIALVAALMTWRITYTARGCLTTVFHLAGGRREAAAAALNRQPRGGLSLVLIPTLVGALGGELLTLLSPLPANLIVGGYAAAGAVYGLLLLFAANAGLLDDLVWREMP